MVATPVEPPSGSPCSARVPARLDPYSPALADAVADGAWTSAWPVVEARGPVVAFAAGVAAAVLWPGVDFLYSESLLLLVVFVVAAVMSGAIGVALAAGYVLGHLLGVPARCPGPSWRTGTSAGSRPATAAG